MALAIKENNKLYISNFETFEKSLNGEAKNWLHEIRRAALAKFDELGFPTTRNEEWRYTNISPIAQEKFQHVLEPAVDRVTREHIQRFQYPGMDAHLLVFVDGYYVDQLSSIGLLPDGVKIGSLAEALRHDVAPLRQHLAQYARYDEDPFAALSTAFIYDGAYVHVPANTKLDKPIHLLFLSSEHASPFVVYPRNLIITERGSRATFVETYGSVKNNRYLTNTVTEIYVGENASVDHYKVQEESTDAFHVSTTQVYHEANSTFVSHAFDFGGLIVRNNPRALLNASGVESTLNGLYLGTNNQLIDNHTTIDHAKPHCNSHELYKGVLDGRAHGVFNGKIYVRLDAQKTDAKQTNQALLLSEDAAIDTKPQLEIFADDVKCTHGATVGQLDQNALFYLQSRGIEKSFARDILTYAFASDVIDRVTIKGLRDYCHHRVLEKLQQHRLEGIDQT